MPPGSLDLTQPWQLSPSVSLRTEPFGGLAYHFGTRRLSFLKSRQLLAIVSSLGEHPDPLTACRAVGISDDELPRYSQALATLAETEMIVPRVEAR